MVWVIFAVLCVASAAFYRLGGMSYGTKWRDIGTTGCLVATLPLLGLVSGLWEWLSLLLVFGATFGAITTYRYFLPRPEEGNYTGWHYGLHGFMVALADFPFAIASGRWAAFGIRCIICAFFVGIWSHIIKWDDLEEGGRGFILCVSRVVYLLPL